MTQHNVSQIGNTPLDKIVDFIIPSYVVLFLNQTLYRNFFIIINYWTFVHITSGVIFYFFRIKKYSVGKWFFIYFYIHVIFEVVEYVLALGGNPLFIEEGIDIVWDILFGLIGYLVVWKLFKKK